MLNESKKFRYSMQELFAFTTVLALSIGFTAYVVHCGVGRMSGWHYMLYSYQTLLFTYAIKIFRIQKKEKITTVIAWVSAVITGLIVALPAMAFVDRMIEVPWLIWLSSLLFFMLFSFGFSCVQFVKSHEFLGFLYISSSIIGFAFLRLFE